MRARDFIGENINFYDRFGHDNTTPDETMWRVSFSDGEDVVRVRAKDKQQAIRRATAIAKSQGNPYPSVDWVKPVKEGVAEATGNPGMPHDFTAVQPGAEVWYKGRFAGWTTGKVYDDPYGKHGKMVAFEPNPSEFPGDEGRVLSLPYDQVSLRKSTSIGKLKGPGQGVSEGSQSPVCKHCGKRQGEHRRGECPKGTKTAVGYTDYGPTRFEPKDPKKPGVAEGDVIQGPWSGMNRPEPGERYAIVRTRPDGTRDFAAGHFDSWQKAKQELQKFLKHELHTELGHQFEIVKKKGVAEDPITERSKDYYERERAADAIGNLIDRLRQDRYKNVTPDVIRQMRQWVNTTGRARTIYGGANHDRFGSAGELLDMLGNRYRELQMRSGQMPEFQGRANTARDMAQQIAQQTRGQYEYNRPRTWTTGAGQRYRDPQDYIRYPDEQSLEDARQWLESRGQKVYYKDNFGHLNTAIRIGRYVVEPASITRGAFSRNPETEHRMSVRSAAAINQSVRSQVDITDQQAAALKDIAATRNATAMAGIRAMMAVLQGEQDLKRVIDSSKKIDPRDKAKLDAIIAAAGRQQGQQ